ncbi:MAG: c-type cytochrome biogenesis protein CcsB [Firmicutes bacterium]|nr:c-type cytochrome biogenesis protein CcsB [Bacillota bacterium]MCL5039943.1 c-type cytochrome biogenesis protein CcsB [Bacillota bacterium]
MITVLVLLIMTLAYMVAAVLFTLSLYSPRFRSPALWLAGLGWLFNTLALGEQVLVLRRVPLINLYETALFLTWVSVLLYLALARGRKVTVVGIFLLPVTALMALVTLLLPRGAPGLPPLLQSPWLVFHAGTGLVAYGAFGLGFFLAGAYLLQEDQLRRKRFHTFYYRLPSLEALEQLSYRFNVLGFLSLSSSIIFGAIWAERAWGAYWQWDPKQTWSLITWLLYAGYLHGRNLAGWKGRRANYVALLGFLTAVLNITMIPWLFRSAHIFPY